jgi:hypothetical protein
MAGRFDPGAVNTEKNQNKEDRPMKVRPECQTKGHESGDSCEKCGLGFARASFQDTKQRVSGQKKKISWLRVSAFVLTIGLGGVAYQTAQGGSGPDPKILLPPPVTDKTDYWRQATRMTDIPVKVENGKISIPIDVVKEKKIVRFEYQGNGIKIPLLSFVTQTGRVVTAVSVCEPCRSTRFHIKDKSIVCNSCYTEWNLETLKGVKEGCLKYPPDAIPSKVDKDRIVIEEKTVTQWKPRV